MTALSTPEFDGSSTPAAREDVASVEIDGERVLYDPLSERVARLDAIGSAIWPFLDGATTVAELAADLADVFEADVTVVERDLLTMLGQLAEQGLLAVGPRPVRAEPPPPGRRYLVDPPSP